MRPAPGCTCLVRQAMMHKSSQADCPAACYSCRVSPASAMILLKTRARMTSFWVVRWLQQQHCQSYANPRSNPECLSALERYAMTAQNLPIFDENLGVMVKTPENKFAWRYVNLANPQLGAKVIYTTDEFFAPA